MKLIGEAVEHGHAGILCKLLDGFLLKPSILDAVINAPEDAGGILCCFFDPNMAAGRLQICHMRPLIVGCNLKASAGSCRTFFEY